MVIGMLRRCAIGEVIHRIVMNGRSVSQPCVVIGEAQYDEWLETYRTVMQREPLEWEKQVAQKAGTHFYRVSTD